MPDIHRHLDVRSRVGHDLLVEAGVFLISVKLIMMAYKNSVAGAELSDCLADLHASVMRMEGLLGGRRSDSK